MRQILTYILRLKPYCYYIIFAIILLSLVDFAAKGLIYPFLNFITESNVKPENLIIKNVFTFFSQLKYLDGAYTIAIIISCLFILKFALIVLYRAIAAKSVMSYLVNLRTNLFKRYFDSKYNLIVNESSRILNALSTQSELSASTLYVSFQIIQNIFLLIIGIILSCLLSWKLLLITLVFALFVKWGLKLTLALSERYGTLLALYNRHLYRGVMQTVGSFRYIKATSMKDKFYLTLSEVFHKIKDTQVKFTILNAVTKSLNEPVGFLALFFMVFVGLRLKLGHEIIVTQAVVIRGLFNEIIALAALLQSFRKSYASVTYCDELLRDLIRNQEPSGKHMFDTLKTSVELKEIEFKFSEKEILKNLNIKIEKNRILVLFGDSGSGKTTFLNLVTGLLKPSVGSIKVNNIDLKDIDLKTWRNKIGFVTQDCPIFNLTIRENIALRNPTIEDEEIMKYIYDFGLEKLVPKGKQDLDYVIDESSSNLSGGQRQRISLIREIVAKPEILLLDELTSSVDDDSKEKIIEYVSKLREKMTIVIATHQKEYLNIADSAYKLVNGKEDAIKLFS